MSVAASCPQCSATSSVPEEMVGKKVRCKRCRTKFIVEDNDVPPPRSASRAGLTPSGGMRRGQKTYAKIWVVLSVVTLLLLGVGGAGIWVLMQEENAKVAKAKSRRDEAGKPFRDDSAADKKSAKAGGRADAQEPRTNKKAQPFNSKAAPTVDLKVTEPTTVAELTAWSPLEINDLAAIKEIFPLTNQPLRVGVHTTEGKQNFFEMYDLKRQLRVAKFKLADNVELVDVDPDGTAVAASTVENHFDIYTLPEGGLIADDWRPYDTPKDQERFLQGGKIAQLAMLSKNLCWAITAPGHGDLWELPAQKIAYKIPTPARDDFLKADVRTGRDFVLSPDRGLFAFATDDGILFHNAKTKQKTGATPKLTSYGTKPEMIGMGFEPGGTKLAAYFSALKAEGRKFYHARFSVPGGQELLLETGPDPGDLGGVEFLDAEFSMAFDRSQAILRNGKGKTVATCSVAGRGRFAPKVAQSSVVFAFVSDKGKPAVGVARVPITVGAEPPPPPPPPSTKKKTLSEILAGEASPAAEPPKQRTFDREEIWEFGSQGIVRKGIKSFER
jgi:hypothetical protein